MILKASILSLSLILLGSFAWAKRVVYLPPVSSTFMVAGYDTSTATKRYCEVNFNFKESIFGTSMAQDKRTSGGNIHFFITLTNIGKSTQTVKVFIEDATFNACYWNVDGIGTPDACYQSFHNNAGSGYQTTVTLTAGEAETVNLQVGCQGTTANKNCYMFQYPPEGQPVNNGITHFGINALWNAGPSNAMIFYCYRVSSALGLRLEVTQDKGSILGTITLGSTGALGGGVETKTTGASNFNINGGRPF